ncbi:hypothetical protein DH2020_040758 [Rehmannia glutinosa]|uniref:DUF627 domain-containing protein n=1 Tax=Rehmannia glutinosa TaxID=99300 RepID=A0ABR0US36_REHGL
MDVIEVMQNNQFNRLQLFSSLLFGLLISSIGKSDMEQPSAEDEATGDGGAANPYSSYESVKTECERALIALRRGNHTRALRLMKDLCSKHENYPHMGLINRVQCTILVKMAWITDDPNAKNRHLKNAIEIARMAVTLSPNSIEFAHFYANLLYEDAKYEEVAKECERALMIEKPVDPAEESLLEENMGNEVFSTAEARVAHFQTELRSLIDKSNIASISIRMKNNGNEVMKKAEKKGIPSASAPKPEDSATSSTTQAEKTTSSTQAAQTSRKNIETAPAEEDEDEERFQAYLDKAIVQSLDVFLVFSVFFCL